MKPLTIQDKLRASTVKRWHIVNVSQQQSVAEHSFNVAMISAHMCQKMGRGVAFTQAVAYHAMMHDIDEVILGDTPTPTKIIMLECGFDINKVMPPEMPVPVGYKPIIKAADYIDALMYIRENGVGRHADAVAVDIHKNYNVFFQSLDDDALRDAMRETLNDLRNGEFVI